MRRSAVCGAVLFVVILVVGWPSHATATGVPPSLDRQVVVISVPGLTWKDLDDADLRTASS